MVSIDTLCPGRVGRGEPFSEDNLEGDGVSQPHHHPMCRQFEEHCL
jgi:hypothetical protein